MEYEEKHYMRDMVLTLDMGRNTSIMSVYDHPREVLPSVHAKLMIGFENAMIVGVSLSSGEQ